MNDPHARPTDHRRLLEKALAASAHGEEASGQPAPPSITELSKSFPDYDILELVGRGGMGAVYRAVQKQLQRTVAIKVLPRQLATDPEFGERFLREARTLATLNHPGILTVFDYGERDGLYFLATEFVDGVNLRQLMELGELSPAEALRIAPQLCTALQFAHERGVVHRDIKPENILIDTDGVVKIADFGLAKVARPGDAVELTRNTAVMGTPHYMAPEQWRGARSVDHRADIYSLGVVLYEMLTGNLPIGNFDMPSERGGVPRGLDAVVRRALAQQPKNRYQHARDVQQDVELQAEQLHHAAPQAAGCSSAAAGPAEQTARTHTANPRPGTSMAAGPFAALATAIVATITLMLLVFAYEAGYSENHQAQDAFRAYRATAEQALALAENGREITTTATLPGAPPAMMLSHDAMPLLAASLIGGMLLLIVGIGFGSIRKIRNSYGQKTGIALAVFTAWLVPIAGVGGLALAPVAAIRSNDLQVVLGIAMGAAILFGAIRFLMWETARQRRLVAAGTTMGGAGATAILMLLGIGALGSTLVTPRYFEAKQFAATAGPTFAKDLLGRSQREVVELLGPPLQVLADDEFTLWAYRDQHGQMQSRAVRLLDRRVVAVHEGSIVFRANIDDQEARAGSPIEVFHARFGTPIAMKKQGDEVYYRYGTGHLVAVHDGIVLRVVEPALRPAPALVPANELWGKTRAEVLEVLGPPLDIRYSKESGGSRIGDKTESHMTTTEIWRYKDADGKLDPQALDLSDGKVKATHSRNAAFQTNPADMTQPQLGQPLTVFLKFHGAPMSKKDGWHHNQYTFDNGLTVYERDGIVVHIERK